MTGALAGAVPSPAFDADRVAAAVIAVVVKHLAAAVATGGATTSVACQETQGLGFSGPDGSGGRG